jgi:hypothetical protein
MHISTFNNIREFEVLFETDSNGREIRIYKVSVCIATGINMYYPNVLLYHNEILTLPVIERTMSLQSGTIYEKMNIQFEYHPMKYRTICETPVFFFVYNTDNYFHYVYDTLPYLISYLHLQKTVPEIKLLMQYPNEQKESFYPFVLEFLELLDIGRDDIVLVNNETLYSNIYISTSYTHDIDSNLPPRKEIYDLYQSIVARVKSINISLETPKKIYVSRRTWLHGDFSNIGTNYTMRRRMVNEDELVERLMIEGYQEVFTERLSTIEKILYFADATHVVGAIGGGISNVLFSPATTHLEVIISPGFLEVNKRFKYILDCVDVYYNYNTQHVEDGEFKKYMRVKFDGGIGEIEEIAGDKLIVSYTDGSNTGWNSECSFKRIELCSSQVERLDNGLNSAWEIN